MIETQPRPTIRTIVASFLFTDLVGFSKGTAADQYAAKARLSGVLRRYLATLNASDYWIKDTGDGALIAFVSNPEHALYMALALGHDYGGSADQAAGSLRTGLHLGTVKESIDVEARRNFVGDGINAAKRIMDFALPGQITASRSFFEAIANLDAAYAELFQHVGAPDDKHGRAHELYTLSPSASVLARLRDDLAAEAGTSASPPVVGDTSAAAPASTAGTGARIRRSALILAAVLVGIGSIVVAMRLRDPVTQGMLSPATIPKSSPEPAATLPTKTPDFAVPPPAAQTETRAPPSNAPAAGPVAPRAVPAHVEATEHAAVEANRAAGAGASTRGAPEAKGRTAAPVPSAVMNAASGPRCSRIVEKATLGEPLTPEEKRELAESCR